MNAAVKTIRQNTWFPLSLCLLISPSVATSGSWGSCEVKPESQLQFKLPNDLRDDDVYIEADSVVFRNEGISNLNGDVLISKGGKYFISDQATYERATEILVAKGNIKAKTGSLKVKGDQLTANLKDDSSTIDNVTYTMQQGDGTFDSQGKSKKVEDNGNNISHLSKATYSTCPVETPSWHIASSKIKLDHNKEIGVARNVTLKVSKKNIPVFYFPYFSFPLTDERKSGFLIPSYGNSSKSGTSVSLPYYFNLAPNYDYTLNPTILSERGLKIDNEFRYLGRNHAGVLNYDSLQSDDFRNGLNRYRFNVNHVSYWGDSTELRIAGEGVSDDNYFDDFSNDLESSSINHLRREIKLTTTGNNWKMQGLIDNYQILDGGSNPYTRLPQVTFNYSPSRQYAGLDLSFDSELVFFDKQEDTTDPTGTRFDVSTRLTKEFSDLAYFVNPSLKLRHTQYDLDLHGAAGESTPSRTLPTFTVDSGLFFERYYAQGTKIQTLEPRLYYTYTPFVDQSNIPLFNTSENGFRYNQLFSEDRFSGTDRVEDANRISAALTSRIIDEDSGNELFEVSAGQIFHLDDREVALSGNSINTDSKSELALELSGNVTKKIRVSSTSLWDSESRDFLNSSIKANYNYDDERSLGMNYNFRKDSSERLDLSVALPIKDNWSFTGNWNNDLRNNRTLEYVAGLEYKNCCVKTRLTARKFLTSDNNTYDNAIFMEFGFKGLGEFAFSPSDIASGN